MQISKPTQALTPYVKQYWSLETCSPPDRQHIQCIVPNGLMEINFYFDSRPRYLSPEKQPDLCSTSMITGQQNRHFKLEITGKLSMFSVTFLPYGIMMLFGIPAKELLNQHVPFQCLSKEQCYEWETRLSETRSFEEKCRVMDKLLYKQLRVKEKHDYEEKRIARTLMQINQSRGLSHPDSLASGACLSRKQYERIFSEHIGISPKQFLKIVRFQHTVYDKQLNSYKDLTRLAYDSGYYDQSHMINDFKSLSGMTPKAYFSECEPYSDYFS